MNHSDERMLCERLRAAETRRKAFEEVVRTYGEQLYWHIRRIVLSHDDADDVLQNTFIKAWNALDSFHGDSKLITWLVRIAINESLDFLRRKRPTVSLTGDDSGLSLADTLMADRYFDGDRAEARLQEAIARLPEVQRTVFLLRYYDEMPYSEMSQVLHTSEGALKASYHIAAKKITEFLKKTD